MLLETTMNDTKPWFKQFWPWVLIGIPGATVLACSVTIYLAVTTSDGLVEDDYYKEGLAINHVLAKDHKAEELGLSAYARVSGEKVEVFFTHSNIEAPLSLRLLHPTRANHDQTIQLSQEGADRYVGKLSQIPPGKWHVELADASTEWRIRGRMSYPASREVRLNAGG